jgi:hypothetical protein
MWVIAAIFALVAVAGTAVWVLAATDDDTSDYAAPQIARMRTGCQQWADSYQGQDNPDAGWCDSMARWMDGRMGDNSMMGQGQMMGSMMWQSPANMLTTCEQWVAGNADGAEADTSSWCGEMIAWMERTMGGWDDWMMGSS